MSAATPNPVPAPAVPAVVPPDENAIISLPQSGGMIVPAHIAALQAKADLGMEWVLPSDLVFSRVKVTQSGDKFAKERGPDGRPKANPGDLFHRQRGQVLAEFGKPRNVIPVSVQREFIHWHSRNSGKGMAEKSTDIHSPIARKCAEAAAAAKNKTAKKDDDADTYNESHSWLLFDWELKEPYVLSLSRGNIAESQAFITMLKTKRLPMQALVVALTTFDKPAPVPHPSYPAAKFSQVGWTPVKLLDHLMAIGEQMSGREFSAPDEEEELVDATPAASGTTAEELG